MFVTHQRTIRRIFEVMGIKGELQADGSHESFKAKNAQIYKVMPMKLGVGDDAKVT